jgi:hypothetical protein
MGIVRCQNIEGEERPGDPLTPVGLWSATWRGCYIVAGIREAKQKLDSWQLRFLRCTHCLLPGLFRRWLLLFELLQLFL